METDTTGLYNQHSKKCLEEIKIEKLEQQLKTKDEKIEKLTKCVGDKSFYPRFWSKVNVLRKGQCWEWQSSISPNGYGKFSIKNYPHSAHVLSYKYFNDDHDKKMCIDHICMNRSCVNPNHLRQVTRRVNSIENSNSASAINSRKEYCVNGHKFDGGNTINNSRGGRVCRKCRDFRNKLARQTLKEIKEQGK